MLRLLCFVSLVTFFASNLAAQDLTLAEKAIVHAARAKYYNLELQGFVSATCQVHYDLSTVPSLQGKESEEERKGLESTHFFLHLESRRKSWMQVVYPGGTSEDLKPYYAFYADNLKSIVTGFFNTWPSKGLHGPLPPFDSQIDSVATTDQGYSLILHAPGGPVRVDLDNGYIVQKIASVERNVEEKPVYAASPDGLIFAGNAMTGDMEQTGALAFQYEMQSIVVDGLHLPVAVHLRLNQAKDLKFSLSDCVVEKSKVLEVTPP